MSTAPSDPATKPSLTGWRLAFLNVLAAVFYVGLTKGSQPALEFSVAVVITLAIPWIVVFTISGIKRLLGYPPVNYRVASVVIVVILAMLVLGKWLPILQGRR